MKMQPATCHSIVHNKCRCCLREGKHPHNIYKDLHLELIRDTLNLLLTSDSRLSEWMCSPCVDSLMKVKRFRDTAVTAERHLLLTLGNTHSDIEAAEKLPEQLDVNRDPIDVFNRVISVFQNSDLKVTNHIAVPNDQLSELYVKEEACDVETDGDHDDEELTSQPSDGDEGSIFQPAEGDDDEDSTFQPSDDVAETEVKNDVFLTIGSTVVKKVTRQASRLSNEIKIPVPDTTPRKRHFVDKINSTKRVKHDSHPTQSGEKDGSKSDTLICNKNNKPLKKTTGEAAEGSNDAVYSFNNNKNNVSGEMELVKKQPKLGLNILKPALKKTRNWNPLKDRDDTKTRDNIILTLKHSTILPFRFSVHNSIDYKCFYCEEMYPIKELREHTESQHVGKVSDRTIISWFRARSIKYISAEISCIKCRLCGEQANTLESIIEHLTNVHNKVYQCTKNRPHGIHGIFGYHLSSGVSSQTPTSTIILANDSDNSSLEDIFGTEYDSDQDSPSDSSEDSDSSHSSEDKTSDALNGNELQNLSTNSDEEDNPVDSTDPHKSTGSRSKHFCYYCETKVFNFARHIMRNHDTEPEVQSILSYPKKSKTRKKLYTALRKRGNYIVNITKCAKPMKKSNPYVDYLPCESCLGFYSKKHLWRHRKTCQPSTDTSKSQVNAQNFMLRHLNVDNRLKKEVFPKMRADRVSLEAKKDPLICAYGAQYLRTHQEKQYINVTSRKMRELSKLLIELKKVKPSINNLTDCLRPENYGIIVTAAKTVSNYDVDRNRYDAPTYATNVSTSLKQCCNIAIKTALKSGGLQSVKLEAEFKSLIQIIETNWRNDVSSQVCSDVNNKIGVVSLASDLKTLKNHLSEKAKTAASKLVQETSDVEAYNTLLETIYCRISLLNRLRHGNLQRLLLSNYKEFKDSNAKEFDISNAEEMLMKNFKRVIIKEVTLIFTDDIQSDIDLLIRNRRKYIADENDYLFAKPGCEILGYKVLEKHGKACAAKNPKAITTTRLRKHIAILTQMLNLKDSEIEQLANFMGHKTDRQNYRLDDQITTISKLLLLMEGNADIHKGKALDEIELDLEQDLLLIARDDNENYSVVEYDAVIPTELSTESTQTTDTTNTVSITREVSHLGGVKNANTTKNKRILVPWTSEQKDIVLSYFRQHIKTKRAPKRHECEELRSNYPEILHNKDWLKIKVFIQNTYTKN